MSVSAGAIGKGAAISFSTNGGSTYTVVAEVIDIVPPTDETRKEEFTRYDSPSGAEEYKPGWFFLGDSSFKMNYVSAGSFAAIRALQGTIPMWKIVLPITGAQTVSGDVYVYSGFTTKTQATAPVKTRMTGDVTVAGTGIVAYTAGT